MNLTLELTGPILLIMRVAYLPFLVSVLSFHHFSSLPSVDISLLLLHVSSSLYIPLCCLTLFVISLSAFACSLISRNRWHRSHIEQQMGCRAPCTEGARYGEQAICHVVKKMKKLDPNLFACFSLPSHNLFTSISPSLLLPLLSTLPQFDALSIPPSISIIRLSLQTFLFQIRVDRNGHPTDYCWAWGPAFENRHWYDRTVHISWWGSLWEGSKFIFIFLTPTVSVSIIDLVLTLAFFAPSAFSIFAIVVNLSVFSSVVCYRSLSPSLFHCLCLIIYLSFSSFLFIFPSFILSSSSHVQYLVIPLVRFPSLSTLPTPLSLSPSPFALLTSPIYHT